MLSGLLNLVLAQIVQTKHALNPAFLVTLPYLLTLSLLWFVWRIWRFTVSPKLWPYEPILLPYAIPFVGHTISAQQDQEGLMQYANQHLEGDSPFSLYIAGSRFIVLRNPSDLKTVWNNTKSLTFDNHIQGIFSSFGIPESHYNAMFQADPARLWHGDGSSTPHFVKDNPSKKRYLDLQENWLKEQLLPGDRMDVVSKRFLGYIEELIHSSLSNPNILLSTHSRGKTVSLYNWGRYVLSEAGSKSFLGPEIYEIDPEFTKHYIEWEDLSWKIAHGHPSFLSRDMQEARERLVRTIMKYYSLESEKRSNLSWIFERLQSEQQKLGWTLHDVASFGLILLWGVHLNTFRMLFWTLTNILSSPTLTQTIIKETQPFYTPSGTSSFSITHLSSPTHCPMLNATWHEVLRHYASSSSIRTTTSTTPVIIPLSSNTKPCSNHSNKHTNRPTTLTLQPTDMLLAPFHMMHLSPHIYGPDAHTFNPTRWLKDPNLNLKTSSVKGGGFHPFGGGHMHCPGRVLAKQEVLLFVAMVLRRFELVPLGEQAEDGEDGIGGREKRYKVPAVRKTRVLATLDPVEDFFLLVKERESEIENENK